MSSPVLTLLTVAAFALSPLAVFAQDEPVGDDYKKKLSTLLEITGAQMAGDQVAYAIAQETLGAIASTGTEITEQIQKIVVDEALSQFPAKFGDIQYLTELYAPLYSEHLTEKDLDELLAFYQSPIGQKTLAVLPLIGQSGALALQQASYEQVPAFQQKVDETMRAAGIIVTP